MTTWSAAGQVAADHAGADEVALGREPGREVERPARRQVAGGAQADRQRVRAATHGVDVGEVLGGGAVPDVGGLDPVAAEVLPLDEQVGGDDDVALTHPQHRGVVAGPDQHVLTLGEDLGQLGDQAELADVGERGLRRERHGLIRADAGALASMTCRSVTIG